ncbi:MAG: preprotein translocase subunit SecA [Planctomycetaceae bacterium]|nr:preprotein translocase subunit SecA [Planctomycetaceae bacterium]
MGAIPTGTSRLIKACTPLTDAGRLARWAYILDKVNALEEKSQALSDAELRKESLSLRYRARSGEPLKSLLVEAYALVREAGRRTINMRHFDVQILAGAALFNHSIVEMQTGEGKTLTATLPMYIYALSGNGTMLATVNDYLAKRDAEIMMPIYNMLGLSVGVIQTDMQPGERRESYHCDITYGTAKEFGFDFLKDRLLLRTIAEGKHDLIGALMGQPKQAGEQPVQRNPYFALVDEADSILIDEASTPLIISATPTDDIEAEAEKYNWAAASISQFEEKVDYTYDHEKRTIDFTTAGRRKVRAIPKTPALNQTGMQDIYDFVQQALLVDRIYHRDEHYVIRDDEIVIVDEFTGRLGEGRKWREGIHQAIEAKEGVPVTWATEQAARVTVQDYFLRFDHLAGMTGTAAASRRELQKIYRCKVIPVPTHRPPKRIRLTTGLYRTEDAKWDAIVQEIIAVHQTGRPLLIGTRTIDKSILLSEKLQEVKIEHSVLNAYQIAEEAEIVAKAGEMGKVTVSTNMAGRGTDIKISDEIRALGGLHVICTEMHESARIDRQLIGRCGRQGDPGTYRQYLSLEDELLHRAYGKKRKSLLLYERKFVKAQRKVERRSYRNRKVMLYYEKERKKMMRAMGQDPYLDSPN